MVTRPWPGGGGWGTRAHRALFRTRRCLHLRHRCRRLLRSAAVVREIGWKILRWGIASVALHVLQSTRSAPKSRGGAVELYKALLLPGNRVDEL